MSYAVYSQTYYDNIKQCYKNILVLNAFPQGPLSTLVKKISTPKLSPFKPESFNACCSSIQNCAYAIYKINHTDDFMRSDLMTPEDIPNLFNFLILNGYKIDTALTRMMNESEVKSSSTNKLVCYISLLN
jgi:hypothetical protein